MTDPIAYRSLPVASEYEIRTDGPTPTFRGYAAVVLSDSEPLPFVETIMPGAFARTLGRDSRDQTFVIDHDPTKLLASRQGKTLTLTEDSTGLYVEASLPDTSYARDLIALHQRGEARKMSFEFRVPKGGDEWSQDRKRRTLKEVRLGHVTVLTGLPPAYRATSASIRSLAAQIDADADDLANAVENLREGRTLPDTDLLVLVRSMGALRATAASESASTAAETLGELLSLLGDNLGNEQQTALLRAAIDAVQAFLGLKAAEVGAPGDMQVPPEMADRSIPLSLARARLELLARSR